MTALSDLFTGANGTALTAHTSDSGHSWTLHGSYTGSPEISDANRLRNAAGGPFTLCYPSWVPATADYYVQADFYPKGLQSGTAICARVNTAADTYYVVSYETGPDQFNLYKCVAGAFTSLGTYAISLALNTAYTVKLECIGTAIKVYVNGTQRISATDSAISAAGRAGVRFAGAGSNTTRVHLDSLSTLDLGAPTATGTLYASGTHVGVAAGCDKYGQVTLAYDHPNTTDPVTTLKVERSADGTTWADVSAAGHIVITSLGSNDFKVVDRRPQVGSQATTFGGTAYYRVTPSNAGVLATTGATSAVNLTANGDAAAIRSANYAVLSAYMAGSHVPSSLSGGGAYSGEYLQTMALAKYEDGIAQYLTDATNEFNYIKNTLTDANGIIHFPDFADVRTDFHARTIFHAAIAARLLRRAGATSLATSIIDQCDIWAKAMFDTLNSGAAYGSVTISPRNPNSQTAWATGATITAGEIRKPTVNNSRTYRALNAGTTHASTEPTWPTTTGGTVTDNGITWRETTATGYAFYENYDPAAPYAQTNFALSPFTVNQQVEIAAMFALLLTDSESDFFAAGPYRTEALDVAAGLVSAITPLQNTNGAILHASGGGNDNTSTLYGGFVSECLAVVYQLRGSQHPAHLLMMTRCMEWLDGFAPPEPLAAISPSGTTTTPFLSELLLRTAAQSLLLRPPNVAGVAYSAAFWDSATNNWGQNYTINGGITPVTPPHAIWEAQAIQTALQLPQTVGMPGIPSGEAFGTPFFGFGTTTLTSAGIPSGEAFGSPTVANAAGPLTIHPLGIVSGEAFGVPAFPGREPATPGEAVPEYRPSLTPADRALSLLQHLAIDEDSAQVLDALVRAWMDLLIRAGLVAYGDGDLLYPWQALTDPAAAPAWALPHAAQWTGATMPRRVSGESEASYIERARGELVLPQGMRRGSTASVVSLIRATLTGPKLVIFRERDGSPWDVTIRTRLTQTPDPALTAAVIEDALPAGIRFDYAASNARDWAEVADTWATWADVDAANATWEQALNLS